MAINIYLDTARILGDNMTKYRNINLPKDFVDSIDKFIEMNPDLAYVSIAEFIKDSCRKNMLEYEKHRKKK